MDRSYQLLEVERLVPLFGHAKYFDFAVTLYYWLIEQVNIELMYQLSNVQIEVIKAEYIGAYPCLGIHYDHPDETPDLAPLIEATINRLLQERSLIEFLTFISANGNDWKAITTEIMAK